MIINCDSGVFANDLGWQLRQYSDVSPPDQNHDTSGYTPLVCPQCFENCGICFHVTCDGVLSNCMPCICSLGAYPCCTPNSTFIGKITNENKNNSNKNKSMARNEIGCCLLNLTDLFVCLDISSSNVLSYLNIPTRSCGKLCGSLLRECLPISCQSGRCFESFNGPLPWNCTCEKCITDYSAGLGNK